LGALWMQRDAATGSTDVIYRNGVETTVADPVTPPTPVAPTAPTAPAAPAPADDGGCTTAKGPVPFDPVLLMLAALGLTGLALRRVRRG
jgi:hypothetical protein